MSKFIIQGGKKLEGEITVNSSKNATVALIMASLMNKGKTTLKNVPQIEEVNRLVEVIESIGVKVKRWERTLVIETPVKYSLEKIDKEAACKTRSAILALGSLSGRVKNFKIPQAGGCKLGSRTVKPHMFVLEDFGIKINTTKDDYVVSVGQMKPRQVVLYETGDTVTENALLVAAQIPGKSVIRMASANYMVKDLSYFLEKLGIKISWFDSGTVEVMGKKSIDQDVEYEISEDPIEAMFFIAMAIMTGSELKILRCPIDYLRLELLKLEKMGLKFKVGKEYKSGNGMTNLVDIEIYRSRLKALEDKIHAMPFPGINQDNLPFFVPIATQASGRTLIHDWTYENRAIYYSELNRLGAKVTLMDPHRVWVDGSTKLSGAEVMCPPALRPSVIVLAAMLGASGRSVLHNVYGILRGYESLEERLRGVGAEIEMLNE